MLLKPLLILVSIAVCLCLVSVYVFIPSTLIIQNISNIPCNSYGASRILKDWNEAFKIHSDTSFTLNGYNYSTVKKFSNGANFLVSSHNQIYPAKLSLFPQSSDTSMLVWTAIIQTGNNPLSRINIYYKAKSLKENMNACSKQLSVYLSNDIHIYKYKISYTTLTDTFLVSVKHLFPSYPSTNEIFKMVNQLKNFINQQNAIQTNHPMLNSAKTDTGFLIMVAIPINKSLPAYNGILPKRLSPIKDKILTTTVKGGLTTIQDAYKEIELYMQDHSLTAPVIPFEYMVTDRYKETDTAKWVTKIYYPII